MSAAKVNGTWPTVRIGEVLRLRAPDVAVEPTQSYQFAGVYCFGRGVFRGQEKQGELPPVIGPDLRRGFSATQLNETSQTHRRTDHPSPPGKRGQRAPGRRGLPTPRHQPAHFL